MTEDEMRALVREELAKVRREEEHGSMKRTVTITVATSGGVSETQATLTSDDGTTFVNSDEISLGPFMGSRVHAVWITDAVTGVSRRAPIRTERRWFGDKVAHIDPIVLDLP